jgi:hypothetical protein
MMAYVFREEKEKYYELNGNKQTARIAQSV